jgi:hypothetical protein
MIMVKRIIQGTVRDKECKLNSDNSNTNETIVLINGFPEPAEIRNGLAERLS